jgi:Family of unknown function (DUF5372)
VTHPFHPLSGRQLVCVGERYNRYGTRLLLRVDQDHVYSVPRQWTDMVAPDPEVVIGEGRSLLRVADLLELADLVSRLVEEERRAGQCKGKYAANVKQTLPTGDPCCPKSTDSDVETAMHGAVPILDRHRESGVFSDT